MKFSDIKETDWQELKPYLDTCLLPVTGLSGDELPHEATKQLERLRDMLELIEIPFRGRVVTYPACHYTELETMHGMVERLCGSLKKTGFRFVIVATANETLRLSVQSADYVLAPGDNGKWPSAEEVSQAVQALWSTARTIENV